MVHHIYPPLCVAIKMSDAELRRSYLRLWRLCTQLPADNPTGLLCVVTLDIIESAAQFSRSDLKLLRGYVVN